MYLSIWCFNEIRRLKFPQTSKMDQIFTSLLYYLLYMYIYGVGYCTLALPYLFLVCLLSLTSSWFSKRTVTFVFLHKMSYCFSENFPMTLVTTYSFCLRYFCRNLVEVFAHSQRFPSMHFHIFSYAYRGVWAQFIAWDFLVIVSETEAGAGADARTPPVLSRSRGPHPAATASTTLMVLVVVAVAMEVLGKETLPRLCFVAWTLRIMSMHV